MLRPAVAAGAAIVAMETLTDFATVQYFNQETITVGVFRIWRGSYDRDAASEIATLVLVFALFAIAFERILRGRARFGESGGEAAARRAGPPPRLARRRRHDDHDAGRDASPSSHRPFASRRWAISRAAERPGHADGRALRRLPRQQPHASPPSRSASACVASALVANSHRFTSAGIVRYAARVSIVGYAVPGPVVAMGVVLTLVGLDDLLGAVGRRPARASRPPGRSSRSPTPTRSGSSRPA